jgi:integrase
MTQRRKYKKRGNPYKRYKTKEDEIQQNNNYTWYYYYFIEDPSTGEKKQKYKGGYKTKREATEAMKQINAELQNGDYVAPANLTLKQYLQKWLKDRRKYLAPTSFDGYKINIEKHIIPSLGGIKLQHLEASDIERFYASKRTDGARADGKPGRLSERSLAYIHRVLAKALKNAVVKKIIPKNAADGVENKPKITRYNPLIYSVNDIIKLLDFVHKTNMEVPVALAGVMGLRRGEILGLKWSDINFNNKTLRIDRQLVYAKKTVIETNPKTENSRRTIVLPNSVIVILKRHKTYQDKTKKLLGTDYIDNDYVNCSENGRPFHPSGFSSKFAQLLRKIGMPHIRFHDLRHSAATNMLLDSSIPPKIVSIILGHSDIRTTLQIYCSVLEKSMQEAAQKIETTYLQTQ